MKTSRSRVAQAALNHNVRIGKMQMEDIIFYARNFVHTLFNLRKSFVYFPMNDRSKEKESSPHSPECRI